MKTALLALVLLGCGAEATQPAATAEVGAPAPGFTLKDLDGNDVSLADHRGKLVVLEWFNPGCPYVRHQHGEGPLKRLEPKWTAEGVVWLAINSNTPGSQGSDPEENRAAAAEWGLDTVLVDTGSEVARAYGAKVTPQMFVVSPDGTLLYDGAVDNAPLGRVAGGSHELWLDDALTAARAGATVPRARNKAYGCSVKYP